MVVVDVAVAAGPDEFARFQAGLLRDHHRQQRIRSDVERHPDEHVARTLVQLAAEPPVGHVELEQGVAGRQRHVLDLGRVPCADHHTTGVGVVADQVEDIADLVDGAIRVFGSRRGPAAPLHTVHGTEVAILVRPVIPDVHVVLLQPAHVAAALEEPQQLVCQSLEEHGLGGEQRESF